MVGVLGPVGGVQIDGHVRIVLAEQPRHRPGFRRLDLHVIAVQVVSLGVRALAHAADRPMLAPAVREGHALIAVRVVDGRDQQDHRLAPCAVAAGQEVAEKHLERLLSAHLACVDVALQVDDRLAGGPDGRRARVRHVADYGQRQRAPLGRVAVGGVVDQRRGGRGALEEVHDLGVRAGLAVVGALGAGEERLVRGTGGIACGEEGCRRRQSVGKSPGASRAAGCRLGRRAIGSRSSRVRGRHRFTAPFRWVGLRDGGNLARG